MSASLLTTKLYIPRARPRVVPRPRLIEQLNRGLDRKLTLVCAPAGYGKTTLISEWVHMVGTHRDAPLHVAWLSLDERDNDPTGFLTYVIAALQTVGADLAKGALSALQSPQPPPADSILTTLINEMAAPRCATAGRVVLVLDDYHLIEARPVHDALAFLIRHLPPAIHLVVASRDDPPLPLARLRARGELTELRAADLRFSASEAAEFLNQVMGLELSSGDIAALGTRTEGWIAGLRLAAVSMQGREDVPGFIKSFAGSHRFVLDYLIEEVLEQQSESVQTFLLQTAILDRLTYSLCDALTGQENSQAILEMLESVNLFVVPLDDERRWYRYHRLFADVLKVRLMEKLPDQVATLHRRASKWYERHGAPADAIRHALAAEDVGRAADLAELAWPAWSGTAQLITWLGWVKELPDEQIRARPVLSVAYAQALLNAGKLEAAEARLLDVERWPELAEGNSERQAPSAGMIVADEDQFRSLPVSLATARAYHAQAIGDLPGAEMYTRRALDLLPQEERQLRGSLTMLLGLTYWAHGELEAAHRTFSDGLVGMDPSVAVAGAFVLADLKTALGQLHAATSIYEHALQLATEHGDPPPLGTEDVYTGRSSVHRERGDLEAAAQDLVKSHELGEQAVIPDWQYRWCIAKARLKQSQGDLDGGLELLDRAERLYVRTPLPDARPIPAQKARIWVAQGRLTEAAGWARERGLSVDDELSYLREFEHITLARILIAEYKRDRAKGSIQGAMRLLERLVQAAEEGGRTGSMIEVLVIQALAHYAQGNIPAALVPLQQALTRAEPEGYVRIFVDEGYPMAALLQGAAKQGIASHYVNQLRASTEKAEGGRRGAQRLIEPLSERELEVLRLLGTELNGPEIARELMVSLNTMRTHTKSIYSKLGVNSRRAAVRRAEELDLL